MQTHTMQNFIRRSLLVNNKNAHSYKNVHLINHKKRVAQELQDAGFPHYELIRMEARYLPRIIHSFEHIGGVVYGHHKDGFAILVATNKRVIFLDKKPLFVNEDEISYRAVSGVNISHAGPGLTVTLHTKIKDYTIQTFNEKSAQIFVSYIESRSLELNNGGYYDYPTAQRKV